MAYKAVDIIEVRCWGTRVGALAQDPVSGFYVFEYEKEWTARGIELAPTTMPISKSQRNFVFPSLPTNTYHRLPPMLADSLPDDFGNALTTAYLANQGVNENDITPLDRLAYLGNRGVGALEFHPIRGPRTRKSTAIELSELVTAARSKVSGQTRVQGELSEALAHLIAVGTSAGGARAKAVVALNEETGELRSGQVLADPGFEQWILKLDGVGPTLELGESGYFGRIEYGYYLMAKAAGIEMMESRLLEEGSRAHFMTRRFDRTHDGRKIHTQTLCAMAQMDYRQIGLHDYSQLFMTIDQVGLGPQARAEAFRRMVFNVASANCDDHTKNFSFMLPEGDEWLLSPAYDLTHAHATNSQWTHQHLMAVNGQFYDISKDDLNEISDRFRVPGAKNIVDQVLDAVAKWSEFADQCHVPDQMINKISEDIENATSLLRR